MEMKAGQCLKYNNFHISDPFYVWINELLSYQLAQQLKNLPKPSCLIWDKVAVSERQSFFGCDNLVSHGIPSLRQPAWYLPCCPPGTRKRLLLIQWDICNFVALSKFQYNSSCYFYSDFVNDWVAFFLSRELLWNRAGWWMNYCTSTQLINFDLLGA